MAQCETAITVIGPLDTPRFNMDFTIEIKDSKGEKIAEILIKDGKSVARGGTERIRYVLSFIPKNLLNQSS